MKRKLSKIAASGLAVILFTVCAGAAGSLHVQKMTMPTPEAGLSYNCAYPRVEGIQNTSNQAILNVRFREKATTARSAAALAYREHPGAVTGEFGYDVTRNRDGLLSIRLTSTLARTGQTHVRHEGVTVDTVSGKTYRLGDLFLDKADYTGALREQIEKQTGSAGHTAIAQISPYAEYYLTDEALVVIAGRPGGADGREIPEYRIPLKSLEGYWKPSLRLGT